MLKIKKLKYCTPEIMNGGVKFYGHITVNSRHLTNESVGLLAWKINPKNFRPDLQKLCDDDGDDDYDPTNGESGFKTCKWYKIFVGNLTWFFDLSDVIGSNQNFQWIPFDHIHVSNIKLVLLNVYKKKFRRKKEGTCSPRWAKSTTGLRWGPSTGIHSAGVGVTGW